MSLVFKETNINELIFGKKYIIIKYTGSCYIGKFTGYTDEYDFATNFDNAKIICNEHKTDIINMRVYGTRAEYYCVDFQKGKIQNAMELRAVNLILQRVVGDITFKY